jgi:hypothetical protein
MLSQSYNSKLAFWLDLCVCMSHTQILTGSGWEKQRHMLRVSEERLKVELHANLEKKIPDS